jgi:putative flippase GtrA/SAM-dependent methyltransferase
VHLRDSFPALPGRSSLTGTGTSGRYLVVGAVCAGLNNVILIGLDQIGVHYVVSSLVSFVVVVAVGYGLHSTFTFRVRRGLSTLILYAAAMAANYPLLVVMLFVLVDLARLPVFIASPMATVVLFGWNFFASRWAINKGQDVASAVDANEMPRERATGGEIWTEEVAARLSRHVPLYRYRRPVYQSVLLASLRGMWAADDRRVLDVGGGTGVIAQAIKELFPIEQMTSVDVADRFLPTLDIVTMSYDGETLPFPDGSFDCVLLSNVLHHVPATTRLDLLQECARVAGAGHLYIKDHVATNRLDRTRLAILDLMGNTPFGGMVSASYPGPSEWDELAAACGYRIERRVSGAYRRGLLAALFPNRLEISMRWVKGA